MKIGLISDTHITEKRGKLPQKALESFQDVDLILHAGDITTQEVLDSLNSIAPTIAVEGNNDKNIGIDLNATETLEVSDLKIVLVHGDKLPSTKIDELKILLTHVELPEGKAKRYYAFAQKNNADILITGHTHKPHFERIEDTILINPGSSNRPIKSDASIAILTIDEENEYENKLDKVSIEFIKIEK